GDPTATTTDHASELVAHGQPGDPTATTTGSADELVAHGQPGDLPATTTGGRGQGPCARTQACMAMPDATPALIERVEPNIGISRTWSQIPTASADRPAPSCPNSSSDRRGSGSSSSGREPTGWSSPRLSMPTTTRSSARQRCASSPTVAWCWTWT